MSEHKLHHELTKAQAVKRMLGEDADNQLILDCVEGETDVLECAGAVLEAIDENEMMLEGISAYEAKLKERKDRLKHSIERRKGLLQAMLEKLDLRKVTLPTATLSVRKGQPRVIITGEDIIPIGFMETVTVIRPDKKLIKSAFEKGIQVEGATLSNAPDSLTIRRS